MTDSLDIFDPSQLVNMARVYFMLPCYRSNELEAFHEVLDYLDEIIDDKSELIKSYTASNFPNGVFWGKWKADKQFKMQDGTIIRKGETVSDRHVVLHVDIENQSIGEPKVREAAARLHQQVAKTYFKHQAGQATFWVVANDCARYSYPAYEAAFKTASKSFGKKKR